MSLPENRRERMAELEAENAELRAELVKMRHFVTLVRGTAQTLSDEAASFTNVR